MVDEGDGTENKNRHDRELMELLNELRVALPGVQVLFAFLLTVAFSQRFVDVTSNPEEGLLRGCPVRGCSHGVSHRAVRVPSNPVPRG